MIPDSSKVHLLFACVGCSVPFCCFKDYLTSPHLTTTTNPLILLSYNLAIFSKLQHDYFLTLFSLYTTPLLLLILLLLLPLPFVAFVCFYLLSFESSITFQPSFPLVDAFDLLATISNLTPTCTTYAVAHDPSV